MTSPGARTATAQVTRASTADLDTLSQVIAEAFHRLPQSRWLIPDPAARRAILPGYFHLLAEHAMSNGLVHTTADRAGAALWLPPGAPEPAGYPARLAAATGPWADRFWAFDATLDRHHPQNVPHWHLAILAVRPDRQGQGLGTALLRAHHDQLDRDAGTAAYLEAATQRTVRLYQRHGYHLTPGGSFRLPASGPPMWPMIRPPVTQPG
jgi:GNAT superfamily N-acetyltransferase